MLAGANLGWIGLVWPSIVAGSLGRFEAVALLTFSLSLLVGSGIGPLARRVPNTLRCSALMVGAPASLAASLAAHSNELLERAYGAAGSALLVGSLLAYGIFAVGGAGRQSVQELPARHSPLREPSIPARTQAAASVGPVQRAVAVIALAGAFTLACVVPLWGGLADLKRTWGDAAAQGGVLTAVIGAALGVATLSVFAGNALRPAPRTQALPPAADSARIMMYLMLALLGAVTYFVLS